MKTECEVGRSLDVKSGYETDLMLVDGNSAKALCMRKLHVVERYSDTVLAYIQSSTLLHPCHLSLSSTMRHRLLEHAGLGKAVSRRMPSAIRNRLGRS
jgi:hypothetical protein